jgi:hypothetical protein
MSHCLFLQEKCVPAFLAFSLSEEVVQISASFRRSRYCVLWSLPARPFLSMLVSFTQWWAWFSKSQCLLKKTECLHFFLSFYNDLCDYLHFNKNWSEFLSCPQWVDVNYNNHPFFFLSLDEVEKARPTYLWKFCRSMRSLSTSWSALSSNPLFALLTIG